MVSVAHPVVACAAVLVALLAGCGEDPGPASADDPTPGSEEQPGAAAPYLEEGGVIQVSCGGGDGWSPSIMAEGIEGVFSDEEMIGIFKELLANPKYAGELGSSFLPEGPEATEWRLLQENGDSYLLGLDSWTVDGPVDEAFVMGIERTDAGWAWTGGGNCRLAPVLRSGNSWVEMHGKGLDRSTSEPTIQVNEYACTSGRDPLPFLHEPYVVETQESVTVFWTSTPPEGDQNCIGNPPVPAPLQLDAPLGDRQLLDGSTYPASPIG